MTEPTATSRILVRFSGPGAGTAPLTWGQKAILEDIRESGWTHNVTDIRPVAPGTSAEDVAGWSAGIMSRHPAARLRLVTDEHGRDYQEVRSGGELFMDVYDFDATVDDATVDKYTNGLWYTQHFARFDLHSDWLMHTAVVRHRGVVKYWVWTLGHIIVDATAVALVMADYASGAVDAEEPVETGGGARGGDETPATGILELGRREQTPALRAVSDRAMRYWEKHLRGIPTLTFGEPTHPEGRKGERFWHGRYYSEAAYLAVAAIAQRTRTDTSRVLLAVIVTAVARATGVNPVTAKVIVSNRFRPGLGGVVAPLTQNSVVCVDVAGLTVDEVVAQIRRVSTAASMNAYYDPDDLDALTARLDAERGYPARISLRINDRRVGTRQAAEGEARAGLVTAERVAQARKASWLSWDGTIDHLPEQAFITVEDKRGAVLLQLIHDMSCLTEEQVEAVLNGVEEIAVAAAFDPAAPTGVPKAGPRATERPR
jgi:condensation domain-containing protein